ncbi:MAG: universal stress protein [Fervidicoccaceae archaeon]
MSSELAAVRMETVLVPLDLSEYSARVAEYAPILARVGVKRAYLLHVIEEIVLEHVAYFYLQDLVGSLKGRAKATLDTVATRFRQHGIEAQSLEVVVGDPARIIAEEARARADAIVMMSRGVGYLRVKLLGSTAEEVLNLCSRPVLVLKEVERGAELAHRRMERILVGLAFRSIDERVLSYAVKFAESLGAKVTLVHVVGRDESGRDAAAKLEEISRSLSERGIDVDYVVPIGDPCRELISAAYDINADLVVLGDEACSEPQEVRLKHRRVLDCVARRLARHVLVAF